MTGRRRVKEGFLSHATIETWIVCVCHSEWMGKTIYLSVVERGMVVGARHTGLCRELQCCWVFHAQQFPVCIKNGPPPKGHPANLTKLWDTLESIPCAPMNRGCSEGKKGVQLNIRKVFLMFGILSVNGIKGLRQKSSICFHTLPPWCFTRFSLGTELLNHMQREGGFTHSFP
jgi:hypothetical protein